MTAEIWGDESTSSREDVIVVLPNGSEHAFTELNSDALKELARENQVGKYTVMVNDVTVGSSDFPITSGRVEILEYNEAK